MRHPGDVSGVEALFDAGLPPGQVLAILGKTEGNGCVNDFTRAYAVQALQHMLARRGGRPDVAMVMSGGTEGGLSPHFLVFAVGEGPAAPGGRLAMGAGFTREFRPEEMGRMAQVEATAQAVRAAIAEAGITEVHYVQVKCPLLTSERIADALARGQNVATHDTYHSMGLSRGASALGVALALGEVASVTDADIGADTSKFSGVASASAGVELLCNEILVLGNSPHWGGDLRISHAVMRDGIDFPAVQAALRDAGFAAQGQLSPEDEARVLAVLAKAEPSTTGRIRGARHIMNDDSDINATRHARALVGGVIAAAVGRTELFVSGGAEHQGPDGGGPVAVIAKVLG